jgi:hypothetical protein
MMFNPGLMPQHGYPSSGYNTLSATVTGLPRGHGGIAPTFRPAVATASHPPVVQRAGPPPQKAVAKPTKTDESLTMITYYNVEDMDTFANLTVEIAEAKKADDAVLSCSFSFNANQVVSVENFESAEKAKTHLESYAELAKRTVESAQIEKVDVMGPEDQLEQLRESFNDVNVMFWAMADTAFKKSTAMPVPQTVMASAVRAQPVYPFQGGSFGGVFPGTSSLSFVPLPYGR